MIKDTVDIDLRVRYAETDQMGVVYYANYLVWFEVGRAEYCRKKGFVYAELEKMGYRLAVTDVECHYRSAARYDDTIVVRTELREANKRLITFGYRILRQQDKVLIAEGQTRHICLDRENRPKSLPPEFLTQLTG